MKDSLIYPVADMLGLHLHEMGDGRVRGAMTRKITIGGYTMDTDVTVVSDVYDDASAGYFVRLVRDLWLYIEAYDSSDKPGVSNLYVYSVDAKAVGLTVANATTFGGKSIHDTMDKLKAGLREKFVFTAGAKQWIKTEVECS